MKIKENSRILKLSYIYNHYEEEIKEAKQTKKDVGLFLDELLEKEIEQRKAETEKILAEAKSE